MEPEANPTGSMGMKVYCSLNGASRSEAARSALRPDRSPHGRSAPPSHVCDSHRQARGPHLERPVRSLFFWGIALFSAAGCGGSDASESVPSPAVSPTPASIPENGDTTSEAALLAGALQGGVRADRPTLSPVSEVAVDVGDSYAQTLRQRSGQVQVLYVPSEGWSYRGPDGTLTGVTVELLRDFFAWVEQGAGVRLDVVWNAEEDWARFYRRVRNGAGGVFGIGNVTITDARRAEIDFSPPYLSNIAVLVTHADVPELATLADAPNAFASFTAHPYRGTLHEERINRLRERRIPGLRVLPLDSNDEILGRITRDPLSFAWIDAHAFFRAVDRGLPIRRHPVGDDASESFGVILPSGSDWTLLLAAFLEAGEGYPNLSRFRALLETHLGPGLATLLDEARAGRIPLTPTAPEGSK